MFIILPRPETHTLFFTARCRLLGVESGELESNKDSSEIAWVEVRVGDCVPVKGDSSSFFCGHGWKGVGCSWLTWYFEKIAWRPDLKDSPRAFRRLTSASLYKSIPVQPAAMVTILLLKVPECASEPSRGSNILIICFRPPKAPNVMPPPTHFPNVTRSGVNPSSEESP